MGKGGQLGFLGPGELGESSLPPLGWGEGLPAGGAALLLLPDHGVSHWGFGLRTSRWTPWAKQ
jgi:hypothetical protein